MPSARLTIRAVVGIFALLVAMAWVPATALAAGPGNITIVSAGPDSTGNPYDLTVVADDANALPISSMTVHLSQGATDVQDVTMQASNTANPASQTWVPATPIQAVNLPAGTYTIAVDASDSSPETDTGIAAGTIAVTYTKTSVNVTPSPTFVTEGSQSVTFTGTVTGTAQDGSSTQVPIAGVGVSVSDGAQVNTNASGVFHYTANNITQSTSYDFTVAAAGDGSYPAGDSGSIPISVQQATTSINVTPSQTNVSQGSQQITFTGTVTAVPAGGGPAVPVSGATVTNSGAGTGQETTASDGTFSYQATGVSAATDFIFSVSSTSLYGSASADVPIGTAQSATTVTASPSQTFVTQGANNVTVSGQVTVTPPGGARAPIGSGVPVQVSVGGVATTTLTTDANGDFSYVANGITASTDFNFSVSQTSLYTAGSFDVPMPAQPAATAINVTPSQSTIELGSQNVTFSGQVLMTPPGSSSPVAIGAGIPVNVSGGSFSTVATTDATGSFSVPVTGIAVATDFTFSVSATSLHGQSSNVEHIQAAAPAQTTIGLNSSGLITFGSPTVTLTGSVTAKNASSTSLPLGGVTVNVSDGHQVTTDSSGQFTYQVSGISQTTSYTFSVSADSNGLYTAASTPIQVNVTPGQTTVAVSTIPAVVNGGPQTVQFFATVDVTPAGTGTSPQPIGAGVQVMVSANGGIPSVAGTTNANGVVEDTITGVQPGDDYNFTVAPGTLYTAGNKDLGLSKESTTLAVTPSQTAVTEGSQNVTFSGTATGSVMGGTAVPIQGASITLNGGSTPVATTDSAGNFSYTATGITAASTYVFSIAGTGTYTSGMASVAVGLTPAQTRITSVTITPPTLKYGQTATLKGTVQYLGGSTWTGLAGTTVNLAEGTTSLGHVVAGTTGAFTASLPSTHGSAWSATVSAALLTQQTSTNGNLIISVPMRFSTFHASLGTNGNVSSSGCLVVTVPVKYGPTTSVQLQYATSARGTYRLLGRLALHNADAKAPGCTGANESYFSGAIKAASDNAYYRALFSTSNSFQRTVSGVIHSARTPTRITSFAISPRTLKKGQIATITGRLWHKIGGTWKEYGGRQIQLIYNQQGTTFWSKLGRPVTTNSKGFFRQSAQGGTGNFTVIMYAEYTGSKTDLAARSIGISVTTKNGSSPGGVLLTPDSPTQIGAMIATAGPQAAMLTARDQLILGIMPVL